MRISLNVKYSFSSENKTRVFWAYFESQVIDSNNNKDFIGTLIKFTYQLRFLYQDLDLVQGTACLEITTGAKESQQC